MTKDQDSEVQSLYNNSTVFVTGGTGTLGKLTVEKILRSCPGVRKVYLLVRPKKGLLFDQRKQIYLNNVVFDRVKCEQPDSLEKLVFVPGDCSTPRLGLSDSDYHDLSQKLNIVLHLAATVRFDEELKRAVDVNVKATIEVIRLCQISVSLKAVVFVSTAFSNCKHDAIREKFYDPPLAVEDLLAILDRFKESELYVLAPKIMNGWPNTYVFSKAMSEHVVLTQSKCMPVTVVRPSMVIATASEPIPGWIDNIYGVISISIGICCGILRVACCNPRNKLDMIPADAVSNCVVAAALPASKRNRNKDVMIYNIATSDNIAITIQYLMESLYTDGIKQPLKLCIWYPFLICVNTYRKFMILSFFLHFLPGCLLDCILRLTGKPPTLLKIYRKIHKHILLTYYFSMRNFKIVTYNTRNLYEELNSRDQEIFNFNLNSIDWSEYKQTMITEPRKYVLNGLLNDVDEGGVRLRKLYIAHTGLKCLLYFLVFWTTWRALKFYLENMSS